jgi:archaemetzincin
MFGIQHCVFFNCLMNGSNHLDESDQRPLHLCPVCLRKLHHSIRFDLSWRSLALLDFARSAGFVDDVDSR